MQYWVVFRLLFALLLVGTLFVGKKLFYLPAALVGTAGIFYAVHTGDGGMVGARVISGLLICSAGVFAIRMARALVDKYRHGLISDVDARREVYNVIESENRELIGKVKTMDEESLVSGKMYKILKTMSGMLRLNEMIPALLAFVNENFVFEKCHFVSLSLAFAAGGVLLRGKSHRPCSPRFLFRLRRAEADAGETSPRLRREASR